jgi:hypothetical protein
MTCLANSFKKGGTCIAGKEVLGGGYGGWIRPVSARPTAEVLPAECSYGRNEFPKVLDIINVPLLAAAPRTHQTENHVIDTSRRWVKVGELSIDDLHNSATVQRRFGSTAIGRCRCVQLHQPRGSGGDAARFLGADPTGRFRCQSWLQKLGGQDDENLSRELSIQTHDICSAIDRPGYHRTI